MRWSKVTASLKRHVEAFELGEDYDKESGIDIFVDDAFPNFQALNNAGICCFLYDTPHNQRYNVGYRRIKSLNELMF